MIELIKKIEQLKEVVIDGLAFQKVKDHLNNAIENDERPREKARAMLGLKTINGFRKEVEGEYGKDGVTI